jgi:glycosyltransferase involved in cell wall biosynthesis
MSEKKLKGKLYVLIVGSNRSVGGVQRYIDQQAEHLSDDVDIRVYDNEVLDGDGPLWLILAVLQTLLDAIRFPFRRRPDIVHIHSAHWFSFYRATFYVVFSKYVWQVPVVLHIHGSSFDEFLTADSFVAQTVQRIGFGASSQVIALSDYWKKLIETHSNASDVVAIPNAVDPEKYVSSPQAEVPTIVYVSHLSDRKGAVEFAEAIDQLLTEKEELMVHVAGSGPHSDRIEELENEHDELQYHGYVSEEKKRELLTEGTIFVLPSYAEGLPIAILEAMAAGNAIISTCVGSIPEVITEERGIIVDPGNSEELHDAIASLCSQMETVTQMGECNREAIINKYNWKHIESTLLELYENQGCKSSSNSR